MSICVEYVDTPTTDIIWLIWAVQNCPRHPECFFIRRPHGASPRKQEMYTPSTRWDQEHSQCEVIHTSTPDVLIKKDPCKWFPQVFLLISTSDGTKKGERGTRSRGVRHLTVTLTVMTNFGYIRWLHGWFTSLHQCIPSLNCIHYVHSILKSQLPARKKFHFSQCYISNLVHLMLKSWKFLGGGLNCWFRAPIEPRHECCTHTCMIQRRPFRARLTPSQSKPITMGCSGSGSKKDDGSWEK